MPLDTNAKNVKDSLKNFKQSKLLDYICYTEKLKTCTPILTPKLTMGILAGLFIIHLLILIVLLSTKNVIEQSIRYDNMTNCNIGFNEPDYGKICNFKMRINKRMQLPIYLYYQITDFYQNHYLYKSSFSAVLEEGKLKDSYPKCHPLETLDDKIIYPCGLLPTSIFSDKITLSQETGGRTLKVELIKNGISWKIDREGKKNMNVTTTSFQNKFTRMGPEQEQIHKKKPDEDVDLPLPEDEDLIVWQRIGPWSSFRKLYRKILYLDPSIGKNFIEEGDQIVFNVQNFFKVDGKTQTKKLVIATLSPIGLVKTKLIILTVISGALCLVGAIAIFFNWLFFPRKYADITILK